MHEDNRKAQIGVLMKATHKCNLNCQYCFDKKNQDKHGTTLMKPEIVEKCADLFAKSYKSIDWVWHGGEPTCAPIDFYKNVQKYFYKNFDCSYCQSFQSNGTLFNDDWIELSEKYGITPGFSYDGEVCVKSNRSGLENYDMKETFKNIKEKTGSLGIISVINKDNVDKQIELYKELLDLGCTSFSYNNIYHSDWADKNELYMKSIDYAKHYLEFYNFLAHYDGPIERTILEFTKSMFGFEFGVCNHFDCRYKWLCVNPEGTIYPCDNFYPEKYNCGNVMDYDSIEEIFKSPGYTIYAAEVQEKFHNYCFKCKYFYHCKGGCNANSISKYGTASIVEETSCNYFKKLFNATYIAVRNTDIINGKINNQLLDAIAYTDCYYPNEIKEAIERNFGMSYDYVPEEEILAMDEKLFDTKEFKLFRLFNPISNEQRISYYSYKMNLDNEENLRKYKKERDKVLDNCISDNYDKILSIISKK